MERTICQVPRTARNDLNEFAAPKTCARIPSPLQVRADPEDPRPYWHRHGRSRSLYSFKVVYVDTARSRGGGGTQHSENLEK